MSPLRQLKILFVTPEIIPMVKTGGVADVSSALPQKLQELGHQVRIVIPKYGIIDEKKHKIHEVSRLKDIPVKIGEKEVLYSIRSSFLKGYKERIQIYLIDNGRVAHYGQSHINRHHDDNDPVSAQRKAVQ